MSNAILRLRKIDNLVFGQNKLVENIEQLFTEEAPYEAANFQYQKMGAVLASVKVLLPQSYQTPGGSPDVIDYNYASITQDGKITYYYITAKEWLSTSAVKLTLYLDTLNSYCLNASGVFDRSLFGVRSTVKRAHKPRFDLVNVAAGTAHIRRTVDPYPEAVDVQLFTGPSETVPYFSGGYGNEALQWFLVYLTQYDLTDAAPISATNPVLLTYCAQVTVNVNGSDIPPITAINRSDPRLIKIIRVPVPPEDLSETAYKVFTSASIDWEFTPVYAGTAATWQMRAYKVATLAPTGALQSGMWATGDVNPLNDYSVVLSTAAITADASRQLSDSKLFNSAFRYRKYYYDSFGWSFRAEAYDQSSLDPAAIPDYRIVALVSKNVNGNFAFDFSWTSRTDENSGNADFPAILAISRNNELAIYNSDYLNYLKIGYNYDLKAKALRAETTAAQTAIGLLSTIAGSALTSTGVGAGAGLPLVVAGVTMVAGAAVTGVSHEISAQNAIDQKIAQYQMQSVSVSGSDDSDLMQSYGGNVLRERVYAPSVRMTQLLNDYFYFFGYSCLHYGITEDDVTGRKWFNFLQGDAELSTGAYTEEIREDIKTRLADGITIMHENSGVWDLEQKKENWEAIFNV